MTRGWEDLTCTGIMLTLGTAAGAGSFAHIRDVAASNGQDGWIAYAIAGSVDLMAVGSGLEIRRRRRTGEPARWPVATLLISVAMTLAANLATAAPGPWGAAVAAWPAVAFLAVVGLIETRQRPAPDRKRTVRVTAPAVKPDSTPVVAAPKPPAAVTAPALPRTNSRDIISAARQADPTLSQRACAKRTGLSDSTVARHWKHTTPLLAVKEA